MSKFQEFKLIALAAYVICCGILVSTVSFIVVDGWLQ